MNREDEYYIVTPRLTVFCGKGGRSYYSYPLSMILLNNFEKDGFKFKYKADEIPYMDLFTERDCMLVKATEENTKKMFYWEADIYYLFRELEQFKYLMVSEAELLDFKAQEKCLEIFEKLMKEFKETMVTDYKLVLSKGDK